MRKLRIGLAGIMCMPFRGDKESQYEKSIHFLKNMAHEMDYDFFPVPFGIYNLDQAQAAAAIFRQNSVDFVLLQTSSFGPGELIYPLAELPAYLGLWAVPEGPPTPEGGLPLNSFVAMNLYNSILGTRLAHQKRAVKWFFGLPEQELFDERFRLTVKALTMIVNLKQNRIGLIGGVAQGFDNLIVDPQVLRQRLDIEVVPITIDEVLQATQNENVKKIERSKQAILNGATSMQSGLEPHLDRSARVHSVLQQIFETYDLGAIALSCWPRFQDEYGLAVCSLVGALNNERLVTACEGDVPSAVSMLALSILTKNIVTLMDLSTIDESDGSILLWHCGPTAPALADDGGNRLEGLWLFDGYPQAPIGLHNNLVLKPGAATVFGFTPDFSQMLVLEGEFNNQKPTYRGSSGWFHSFRINGQEATLRDLVETLMGSHFQHHYALVYGRHTEALLEMGSWLGIAPIPVRPYHTYLNIQG